MNLQNKTSPLTLYKHEHLIQDPSTGRAAQLMHISPEPSESESLNDLRIYSDHEYTEILDQLGNIAFNLFGSTIEYLGTTEFEINGVFGPLGVLGDKVLAGECYPWSLEIHD